MNGLVWVATVVVVVGVVAWSVWRDRQINAEFAAASAVLTHAETTDDKLDRISGQLVDVRGELRTRNRIFGGALVVLAMILGGVIVNVVQYRTERSNQIQNTCGNQRRTALDLNAKYGRYAVPVRDCTGRGISDYLNNPAVEDDPTAPPFDCNPDGHGYCDDPTTSTTTTVVP